MLLVADIGNTQTVIGIYEIGGALEPLATWRIATDKNAALDDVKAKLVTLMQLARIDASKIRQCALASVVPVLTDVWISLAEKLFGIEPVLCSAENARAAGVFCADYPYPSEIGADRVADAIAIKHLFATPAIVVDFGTATNIEVIDETGAFVGGIIAPGIMTGAEALFEHATKLAETDLANPGPVVGKSTAEALQSGIVYGEAARVDGLLKRIVSEEGFTDGCGNMTCSIVATGGLAKMVAEYSEMIAEVRPDLTLVGLRLLAERELGEQLDERKH